MKHTGKYGTDPQRVLVALAVTISIAFAVFFLCSLGNGYDALSLGEELDRIHQAMGCDPGVGLCALRALLYSLGNVIPFVSAYEPIGVVVYIFTVLENAIGTFLVGYFSVAVVRKTLR